MGAWGTEPFENDSAADFIGDLKRVPKANRLKHIRMALETYLAFDADPHKFEEREIDRGEVAKAFQAMVRQSLAQAEKQGAPVPSQMARFVGKSTDELIATLPNAGIYDGGHEALTAIAAAELLLARLGKETKGEGRILANAPTPSVRRLLPLARQSIDAILRNGRLRASWNEGPRGPWRMRIQQMRAALDHAMTANSALQRTRQKRRAVERGR